MPRIIFLLCALLLACSGTNPALEHQKTKVSQATVALHEERARLQTLRDSLAVEIRRNIALGIPKEQAQSIEQARIQTQETIVAAAEKNLTAQQAFLDSLQKYHP